MTRSLRYHDAAHLKMMPKYIVLRDNWKIKLIYVSILELTCSSQIFAKSEYLTDFRSHNIPVRAELTSDRINSLW